MYKKVNPVEKNPPIHNTIRMRERESCDLCYRFTIVNLMMTHIIQCDNSINITTSLQRRYSLDGLLLSKWIFHSAVSYIHTAHSDGDNINIIISHVRLRRVRHANGIIKQVTKWRF